jgi:hypothetical protein
MRVGHALLLLTIIISPSISTPPPPVSPLTKLLYKFRLIHHHQSFLEHGFTEIEDVIHMNADDIKHIGISKRGEQKRLQRAIIYLNPSNKRDKESNENLSDKEFKFSNIFNLNFFALLSQFFYQHWFNAILLLGLGCLTELIFYNCKISSKITQVVHKIKSTLCSTSVIIQVPRDYSTINEAVNQAKMSNGKIQVIQLAAGKYTLSDTVTIDFKKSIRITGAGQGNTTIVGLVVVKKARDIELNNITLTSGSKGGCGLRVESGGSAIVTGCEVKCCRGCGVEVKEKSFLSMNNSYIHHNGWSGVIVIGAGTEATFRNLESNHNERCGIEAKMVAIVNVQGKRTNIHNNDGHGLSAVGAGAIIRINLANGVNWNRGGKNGRIVMERFKKEGKFWDEEKDGEMIFEDGGTVHRSIVL